MCKRQKRLFAAAHKVQQRKAMKKTELTVTIDFRSTASEYIRPLTLLYCTKKVDEVIASFILEMSDGRGQKQRLTQK